MQQPARQSSNRVLMVRPAAFAFNEEAAATNAFMRPAERLGPAAIVERARAEFDGLVAALRAAGVDVTVVEDTAEPAKPDAVFPNNWFSTHADGTLVTYPMHAPSRRAERDGGVRQVLAQACRIDREIQLEHAEETSGTFLEGTGSLVLDRLHRVAYLCRSERSDETLAARWCDLMAYRLVAFEATDEEGLPVYHTNVIMAVGTREAVICLESVAVADRARVREALAVTGRAVIDISFAQVRSFAGNMLEVVDGAGAARWAMSSQAYAALTEVQRGALSTQGPIIHADIEAIEQLGGGSARCMIAELFLPRA